MKCLEAEEKIYLYQELTPDEREQVDEHLKSCMSCQQMMVRAKDLQRIIVRMQDEIPSMTNQSHMTRRVMDSITDIQKKRSPIWGGILQNLQSSTLRFGMVALSLSLAIFFVAEYTIGANIPKVTKHYSQYPGKKTELNLASFHTAFLSARKSEAQPAPLVSKCIAGCLQLQEVDCTKCSEKFAIQ